MEHRRALLRSTSFSSFVDNLLLIEAKAPLDNARVYRRVAVGHDAVVGSGGIKCLNFAYNASIIQKITSLLHYVRKQIALV